jgi:hypothetical protein
MKASLKPVVTESELAAIGNAITPFGQSDGFSEYSVSSRRLLDAVRAAPADELVDELTDTGLETPEQLRATRELLSVALAQNHHLNWLAKRQRETIAELRQANADLRARMRLTQAKEVA